MKQPNSTALGDMNNMVQFTITMKIRRQHRKE